MSLHDVIKEAMKLDWKLWVYYNPKEELRQNTRVMLLDIDNEKFGNDDIIPLIAEKNGFEEFLSVHDIQGILINMECDPDTNIEKALRHIIYYFENDAYYIE